jgi:hypothetical protein
MIKQSSKPTNKYKNKLKQANATIKNDANWLRVRVRGTNHDPLQKSTFLGLGLGFGLGLGLGVQTMTPCKCLFTNHDPLQMSFQNVKIITSWHLLFTIMVSNYFTFFDYLSCI